MTVETSEIQTERKPADKAVAEALPRKMKRLVFCFDGTWNRLSADEATNVVLTAASIERQAPDATQIIHYDEGVGTGPWERIRGGVFGWGLIENVREAYRFLIFNYDPGDEIFVFGFSRGAFSARSFVGFARHVGVLRRLHAARIDEALDLYRQRLAGVDGASDRMRRFRADYSDTICVGHFDNEWRCHNVDGYAAGSAHPLTIKYLGLWDTVGALGWPALMPLDSWLNRKHNYHDVSIDDFVQNARHAVAIDERRALFPVTLLGDLTALNAARGFASEDPKAPYQEKWFPGTHGSIGGGGDVRGLSDGALAWIIKGAKVAGLVLDREYGTRIHGFCPDALAPLNNVRSPGRDFTRIKLKDRKGPVNLSEVAIPVVRRWHAPAHSLPEQEQYRPATLAGIAAALDAYPVAELQRMTIEVLAEHTIQSGDTLTALAKKFYDKPALWRLIFEANRDVIDDPDDLFEGTVLQIPKPPTPTGSSSA